MMGVISQSGAASDGHRGFPALHRILCLIPLSFFLLLFASVAAAQLTSIQPPPGWKQVPSGTGACSVEKSCAELALAMIQSALGASPLEGNLRQLAHLGQAGPTGSQAADPAVDWAVEALRHAGVDRIHTEKFTVPAGSPAETETVIGEIRGREKPDDFVVLGAHLDARNPASSALDDGADAAVVIDAARVIHASGTIPRRSIRFVLFTGTKQGKPGSRAYVAAHRGELDRAAAAIFFSVGTEPVTGYSLGGRKDIRAAVRETLKPVRSLDVKEFTLDAALQPDSLDFLLEGIPTLLANESPENRVPCIRSGADTLDPATLGELKRHVAIAAVTAYALADAPQRVGPRQSRAEVEQLIENTGLDQKMKAEGFWPAWESGERGRRP
jgi:Peptidase family M28